MHKRVLCTPPTPTPNQCGSRNAQMCYKISRRQEDGRQKTRATTKREALSTPWASLSFLRAGGRKGAPRPLPPSRRSKQSPEDPARQNRETAATPTKLEDTQFAISLVGRWQLIFPRTKENVNVPEENDTEIQAAEKNAGSSGWGFRGWFSPAPPPFRPASHSHSPSLRHGCLHRMGPNGQIARCLAILCSHRHTHRCTPVNAENPIV